MNSKKIRFDSLADTIGFQLRRASHAMQSAYEASFEPLGLRISDATVLIGIGESPGCTQADLSRSLHIKPANIVPTVGGLVTKGLVTRRPGEGRAVSLNLTEAGSARLAQVHQAIQRQEERIRQLLTAADEERVLSALKDIARKPAATSAGVPSPADATNGVDSTACG